MSSGGSSTSSTNVSIPPEQWFEAIAREGLSQSAYNKAQTAPSYWNMANVMMGMPQVDYRNPYPATPTGPFEWTHDQNQGSSWGRGWDGKNLEAPNGFYAQNGAASSGYTGGMSGSSGSNNGSGYQYIWDGAQTKTGLPRGNVGQWALANSAVEPGRIRSDIYDDYQLQKRMQQIMGTQSQQGSASPMPTINNRNPEPSQWAPGVVRPEASASGGKPGASVETGNQNIAFQGNTDGSPTVSNRGGANAGNDGRNYMSQRYGTPTNTTAGGGANAEKSGYSQYGGPVNAARYGIGPNGERHRDTGKNPAWNTQPVEIPAWQQRLATPLMQDFGQGLQNMDSSLRGATQALGKQGGSLNAATGAFNKAGGYFDQASGAFNAGNQYAGQAASAAQGSQKFFDKAAGSADKMAAPISKLGALGDEMQNTLLQGKLPDSYQENWIKGNQRGFDEMMGSNLNSLASRGVINSSVANRSLGEVNDRINESYARNFLDSMASQRANYDSTAGKYTDQLGGLGQQANAYQGAGQGYIGSANALSTAGQTANASGQGMMGAGQGYLGVGQGHLGTASGWGDTFQNSLTNAQASMLPYQTRFSGMKEMMGVGNTMDDDLRNLYAQWRGNRYQVPGDTIVSQGK